MENILITTTVSLDCAGNANQMVIHLVQGDYGVRALRLIPVVSPLATRSLCRTA
jgi:hypothetical protein